jgi:hypothetical protein
VLRLDVPIEAEEWALNVGAWEDEQPLRLFHGRVFGRNLSGGQAAFPAASGSVRDEGSAISRKGGGNMPCWCDRGKAAPGLVAGRNMSGREDALFAASDSIRDEESVASRENETTG